MTRAIALAALLVLLPVSASSQVIRVTYGDGVCRAASCMDNQPVPAVVQEPRALRTETESGNSPYWIFWILIWFF